jgi:septum site-determining protein MinC
MGDANAGSEIIAGGNVIVLGALKGMAHAGNRGDDNCFISAISMSPTQLRIGKIITYVPNKAVGGEKPGPATAYIQNSEVYIAAL